MLQTRHGARIDIALAIPCFAFGKQFFLEHFDAMFLVVATQWLTSFRSCGFMERGENILAATGSRRWSSSRMPAA